MKWEGTYMNALRICFGSSDERELEKLIKAQNRADQPHHFIYKWKAWSLLWGMQIWANLLSSSDHTCWRSSLEGSCTHELYPLQGLLLQILWTWENMRFREYNYIVYHLQCMGGVRHAVLRFIYDLPVFPPYLWSFFLPIFAPLQIIMS
jgi:hypothetical protein